MKVERKCKIVSKDWLNQDAVCMVLEVGDMVRTSCKGPGQFVHIKCGDSLLLRRPISVCTCQEADPEDLLTVVFEVRGEGTQWLANRPVGHSVDVMGLLGNGFSMKPEGRYLLVGGGIGTAPLLQLAAELAAQGVDVDLYAGFRDEPYRVDAFSAACRSVHIATDSGRHGHHGFVTDLLDPAKYTAVCTCGPEIMMEKVAKMCLRAGVRIYVSREAKMACGVGACLGCTCKSKNGGVSVCKDGPVFEGSVLYELD